MATIVSRLENWSLMQTRSCQVRVCWKSASEVAHATDGGEPVTAVADQAGRAGVASLRSGAGVIVIGRAGRW